MNSRTRRRTRRRIIRIGLTTVAVLVTAAAATVAGTVIARGDAMVQSTSYGVLDLPDSITTDMVAKGDSIFHGKRTLVMCASCHGEKGTGTRIAPDLTDNAWLKGNGTLESITRIIRKGVYWPPELLPSMPAFEGAMEPEALQAVAAYVYSLSRPQAVTRR